MRRAGRVRLASLALRRPGARRSGSSLGSDFMPQLDEGAFLLQTNLPPEASLDEVDRLNHRVEDVLREFPEVEDVVRRTGRAERTEDPMPHTLSDVLVVLRPERDRSLEELEQAMREQARAAFPASRRSSPRRSACASTRGSAARPRTSRCGSSARISTSSRGSPSSAREIVGSVEGIADLRVESLTGLPQLRVAVDRAAAARVGLTPGRRSSTRCASAWSASECRGLGRTAPLRPRGAPPGRRRGDANAIRTLLVDGHDGTRIPLGQLAAIEETSSRPARSAARPAAAASRSRRASRGAISAARRAEVRSGSRAELALPPGYFVDVGGRVESQERASR